MKNGQDICAKSCHLTQYIKWSGHARQSATLLPISCKSVQPVPAWVEEPVSPVRQPSSGGAKNQYSPGKKAVKIGIPAGRITAQAENTTIKYPVIHNSVQKCYIYVKCNNMYMR